jgi:hypothetical protein
MKIPKMVLVILCMLLAINCAYLKSSRTTNLKSYTINVDEQASVGVPMITSGYVTYATATGKHGLSEEQDRWKSFEYATNDLFKEEFIYKGLSNGGILILYKKYEKILSSPTSSREFLFDLGASDIIVIKNFKIKVINATNEYIRFRVVSD